MKIAVLIKQVPDCDKVKIDPQKGTMIRNGTGNIINPLDLNAIQAALDIKRAFGAQIDVISMGPLQAEDALREAMALGADNIYLLSDKFFAGADSWSTSLTISKALVKIGSYDLIIAGEKATDGETGQVGPEVAAILGIPCATYVSELALSKNFVVVTRTIEDGLEKQRITMPCLITVLNNINDPEMPTLNGKKMARRANINVLTAKDLNLTKDETGLSGSPTRVVKISHPKLTRETKFFSGKELDCGIEHVVAILHDIAAI